MPPSLLSFSSSLTWHANASVSAPLVDAGPVVEAGVGRALVDVDLAARALEAVRAVAPVRAGRVHAHAVVLAGGTWKAKGKQQSEGGQRYYTRSLCVWDRPEDLLPERLPLRMRDTFSTLVTNALGETRTRVLQICMYVYCTHHGYCIYVFWRPFVIRCPLAFVQAPKTKQNNIILTGALLYRTRPARWPDLRTGKRVVTMALNSSCSLSPTNQPKPAYATAEEGERESINKWRVISAFRVEATKGDHACLCVRTRSKWHHHSS